MSGDPVVPTEKGRAYVEWKKTAEDPEDVMEAFSAGWNAGRKVQ